MSRTLAALACLLLPAIAPAQRTHDVTLDDYFTLASPVEVAAGPDGRVAYTEARWQRSTDDRKAELWVIDGDGPRRLTSDRAGVSAPRWSADGKQVFFLSRRSKSADRPAPWEGKAQVWRISAEGGAPEAATRSEDGVEAYEPAADGSALYYVTHHDNPEGEWAKLKKETRGVEFGHGAGKASRVHRLDLRNWRERTVYDGKRYVRELAVSPDGKKLAMITAPDETVVTFEGRSRVEVHDLASGKSTPLPDRAYRADAPTPYAWLEVLAWSADGKRLAWNAIFDGYPTEVIVAEWGEDRVRVTKLDRPAGLSIRGYGSPLAWLGEDGLCFLGEEKARVRLCLARGVRDGKRGEVDVLTPGDVVVGALSSKGGRIATILGTPTASREVVRVWKGKKSAAWTTTKLTDLNPQVATWKLPKASIYRWKGAGGQAVEGVLELPPDYKKGDKVPLVVAIHGGPTMAVYHQLDFDLYLGRCWLPAKGYAVLCPNYRGSTGYGDRFLTDLVGKENDVEVADILAGVDALVEEGIADPKRLAVMGWSNGGYLTNCVLTKTTRFAAASSGAGIVDTVMQWGSNDEPAYMVALKGGLPWDKAGVYHRTSPTYQLNRIRTPTLIHVGAQDERCPPGHSRMLHRALHEYNRVPAELLIYTGEPHGLGKYRSRLTKMRWELAWFDRYVRGRK